MSLTPRSEKHRRNSEGQASFLMGSFICRGSQIACHSFSSSTLTLYLLHTLSFDSCACNLQIEPLIICVNSV
jgi:hypothetical protein